MIYPLFSNWQYFQYIYNGNARLRIMDAEKSSDQSIQNPSDLQNNILCKKYFLSNIFRSLNLLKNNYSIKNKF